MERKKVLVVEDGEFNRDLLVQILEDEYEVVVALDGEEAIAKAKQEKPNLILMDLALPVLDGWEATKRIKASIELHHILLIAITSHAMMGDEIKAREAGCDDYVAKPINPDELMGKIRRLIFGGG